MDIEDYKRRESLFEELLTAVEELVSATSETDVCDRTVTTGATVLNLPFAGIWLYDGDANALLPKGLSEAASEAIEEQPVLGPDSSLAWDAFAAEEVRAITDLTTTENVYNLETPVGSELLVPLGEHGIFIAGSPDSDALDNTDQYLAQLLGSYATITLDRIRHEKELAAEREFIETAIDTIRDVFVVIDGESRELLQWNDRLTAITTSDDDTLEKTTLDEIIADHDIEAVQDAVNEVIEHGVASVEFGIRAADDTVVQHEFRARRLEDSETGSALVVAIGRDISEQRRLERSLRENERRYRTLVEMSPTPVVVHSDMEILYLNDAAKSLLNAPPETDLLGQSLTEFVPESQGDSLRRTAKATQTGQETPTRERYRIRTLDEESREVEATSRPIAYDGQPAVLTVLEDVSHRVRHERRLRSLHDVTRNLLSAETPLEAITEATKACGGLLNLPDTVVYEYENEDGRLHPSIVGEAEASYAAEVDSIGRSEDCPVWQAFVSEEATRLDESCSRLPFGEGVLLPLGSYGLLVAGTLEDETLDQQRVDLAEILQRNLTATLERLNREATIQARDRELARQNEELQRLRQLDEIIRGVNRALITATTREDIEAAVCSELGQSGAFTCVWMAEQTTLDGSVSPVATEGIEAKVVDAPPGEQHDPLGALAEQAITNGEVVVATNVQESDDWQSRREHTLDHGYSVVAAIPIPIHEESERVLVVHSGEPALLTDRSREVFAELGKIIGNALKTVGGRQAVHAETYTRIDLDIDDTSQHLQWLAAETGGEFDLRGAIPDQNAVQIFLSSTVPPERVREVIEGEIEVSMLETAVDPGGADDEWLIVLTAKSDLYDRLAGLGCRIHAMQTNESGSELSVDVPEGVSVRTVIDTIANTVEQVELRARHEERTTVEPPATTFAALKAACTERQLQALQAAYYGGYYEWPREATNEALAESLGISSATYQSHRRAAERKLVKTVLQ